MAIGEFGSIISSGQIANQMCPWVPVQVYDNIWITRKGSAPNSFMTFSVDPNTGDVALCDTFTVPTGSAFGGHPVRIADGIVALAYVNNSPNKSAIITFSIDSNGDYDSVILDQTIGSTNLIWKCDEFMHLAGTYYVLVGYYPLSAPFYGRVILLNISADGTSVAVEDYTATGSLGTDYYIWATVEKIGDEDFAVLWNQTDPGNQFLKTYNCTGASLSLTDEATPQTDVYDSPGYVCNIRKIQPGIYCVGYLADGPARKLYTIDIDDSGNIGSVIDTATGYFSSGFYRLVIFTNGYGLISSDDEGVTFPVAVDGTIGAVIDTFNTGSPHSVGSVYFVYYGQDLYAGVWNDVTTADTYGFSVSIETELPGGSGGPAASLLFQGHI